MADRLHTRRQIAEQFGILFERTGSPRMAGRIWGWLLTCDPPRQTAAKIAGALEVSAGSISTMTRMLMQIGLIERVGIPGERSGYYRIRPGGVTEILRARMRFTTEIRAIAERGLEELPDAPAAVRGRLEEHRDLCAFFEREFSTLIERWQQQHRGRAQ